MLFVADGRDTTEETSLVCRCKLTSICKDLKFLKRIPRIQHILDNLEAAELYFVAMLLTECRFTHEQSRARNSSPPGCAMLCRVLLQASNDTYASLLCCAAQFAVIRRQNRVVIG